MISDLTYSTVICYEDGKLADMVTLVLCVPLNYITLFMVSDLTYSTVICYEDGKLADMVTLCAFELYYFLYGL